MNGFDHATGGRTTYAIHHQRTPRRPGHRSRATALALSATPAFAATSTPTTSAAPGCTTPTTQAFLFANDKKDYVLAPGGNAEGSLAGWSLTGGAAAVAGSAPAVTGARPARSPC